MLLSPLEFARRFSNLLESANLQLERDVISYSLEGRHAPVGMTASVHLTKTGVERLAEKLSREIRLLPSRPDSTLSGYGFIDDKDGYTLEAFYHE